MSDTTTEQVTANVVENPVVATPDVPSTSEETVATSLKRPAESQATAEEESPVVKKAKVGVSELSRSSDYHEYKEGTLKVGAAISHLLVE